MNKVILVGRLTRDPDVRYSAGSEPMAIARYTLAVDRKGKKKEGEQNADFISCVAFGKVGEFAEKYLKQGTKILVEGHIQTGSYTNRNGQKVYTTDVLVEQHEFVDSVKSESKADEPKADEPKADDLGGFISIPDDIQEELPFD